MSKISKHFFYALLILATTILFLFLVIDDFWAELTSYLFLTLVNAGCMIIMAFGVAFLPLIFNKRNTTDSSTRKKAISILVLAFVIGVVLCVVGWHLIENGPKTEKAVLDFYSATTINQRTQHSGLTPLMLASFNGMDDDVEFLLEHGADTEIKSAGGKTALHYAVEAGETRIVQMLIESGADIDVKDKEGKTPLQKAKKDDIKKLLNRR